MPIKGQLSYSAVSDGAYPYTEPGESQKPASSLYVAYEHLINPTWP